jgi:hypothetical protein
MRFTDLADTLTLQLATGWPMTHQPEARNPRTTAR